MASVLYLQSEWTKNIGNRFIDLGGLEKLEQANVNTIRTSTAAQNLINRDSFVKSIAKKIPQPIFNQIRPLIYKYATRLTNLGEREFEDVTEDMSKTVHMPTLVDEKYDYIAFSGMRMSIPSLTLVTTTLEQLAGDADIILLGVGGSTYSSKEETWVRNWLIEHEPAIMTTRDPQTYEKYNELVPNVHNGIDNAFFLGDAHNPQQLNGEFHALNFDRLNEPQINISEEKIIRTGHRVREVPRRYYKRKRLLMSSFPEEYLDIYANAKTVHTDRLHAFIPSLAFGTPASYHLNSPKNVMFERFGLDPRELSEVTEPPTERINKLKDEEISFLRNAI